MRVAVGSIMVETGISHARGLVTCDTYMSTGRGSTPVVDEKSQLFSHRTEPPPTEEPGVS